MDYSDDYTTGNGELKSCSTVYRYYVSGSGARYKTTAYNRPFRARMRYAYRKSGILTSATGFKYRKSNSYRRSYEVYTDLTPAQWGNTQSIKKGGRLYIGSCMTPPYTTWSLQPGLDFDQSTRNQSVTECLLRIKDQKVQYLENLGSAKRTATHLISSIERMVRFLHAAKHGRFRLAFKEIMGYKSPKQLRSWGSLWLEVQYGWKTLIMDIKGYQELFEKKAQGPLIIRAARQTSGTIKRSRAYTSGEGFQYITSNGSVDYTYKTVFYAEVNNALLRTVNEYGVADIGATVWEFVPYSFVLDWCLPLGNVLYAFTASAGLTFLDGSTTFKAKISESVSFVNAMGYTDFVKGSGRVTGESMERGSYSTWPMPLPYVKNPFSSTRAVTALALLSQLR